MNKLNTYDIDIFKLSNATHDFDFEVNPSFFKMFEDSEVIGGNAAVIVVLKKSETMIEVNISVQGVVKLTCDRSLEEYDYPLDTNNIIIFQYGDIWEELSDEITIIPRGEQCINIAQYIYEFIELTIPMKKLHPKFGEDKIEEGESDNLLYSSLEVEESEVLADEEDIDPRWEKLKNIKNKASN